jgi:hypothetical protein
MLAAIRKPKLWRLILSDKRSNAARKAQVSVRKLKSSTPKRGKNRRKFVA